MDYINLHLYGLFSKNAALNLHNIVLNTNIRFDSASQSTASTRLLGSLVDVHHLCAVLCCAVPCCALPCCAVPCCAL